jgi:hypothetical protein
MDRGYDCAVQSGFGIEFKSNHVEEMIGEDQLFHGHAGRNWVVPRAMGK